MCHDIRRISRWLLFLQPLCCTWCNFAHVRCAHAITKPCVQQPNLSLQAIRASFKWFCLAPAHLYRAKGCSEQSSAWLGCNEGFVPAACGHDEWAQTYVELTLLNLAELVKLQGRLVTTCQGLQNQLLQQDASLLALRQQCHDLQTQLARQDVTVTNLRNRLGQVADYLAARDDAAAVLFGPR